MGKSFQAVVTAGDYTTHSNILHLLHKHTFHLLQFLHTTSLYTPVPAEPVLPHAVHPFLTDPEGWTIGFHLLLEFLLLPLTTKPMFIILQDLSQMSPPLRHPAVVTPQTVTPSSALSSSWFKLLLLILGEIDGENITTASFTFVALKRAHCLGGNMLSLTVNGLI